MRKVTCSSCGKDFCFTKADVSHRYVKDKRMNVIIRKERVAHCPVCFTSILVSEAKKV